MPTSPPLPIASCRAPSPMPGYLTGPEPPQPVSESFKEEMKQWVKEEPDPMIKATWLKYVDQCPVLKDNGVPAATPSTPSGSSETMVEEEQYADPSVRAPPDVPSEFYNNWYDPPPPVKVPRQFWSRMREFADTLPTECGGPLWSRWLDELWVEDNEADLEAGAPLDPWRYLDIDHQLATDPGVCYILTHGLLPPVDLRPYNEISRLPPAEAALVHSRIVPPGLTPAQAAQAHLDRLARALSFAPRVHLQQKNGAYFGRLRPVFEYHVPWGADDIKDPDDCPPLVSESDSEPGDFPPVEMPTLPHKYFRRIEVPLNSGLRHPWLTLVLTQKRCRKFCTWALSHSKEGSTLTNHILELGLNSISMLRDLAHEIEETQVTKSYAELAKQMKGNELLRTLVSWAKRYPPIPTPAACPIKPVATNTCPQMQVQPSTAPHVTPPAFHNAPCSRPAEVSAALTAARRGRTCGLPDPTPATWHFRPGSGKVAPEPRRW